MKTRALAVLLPLLALAGCADNNVSLQIVALCAPPDDGCTFESQCELQYLGTNRIDLGVTLAYSSFLEIRNQTRLNADEEAGRPNTHDAYVEEYTVEYEVAGLTLPSVTKRVAAGPTFIPAEGSAVVRVEPIPFEIGTQLDAQFPVTVPATSAVEVVARIRLRGFLADQATWETAEYPIPIQACHGCVGAATCADPAALAFYCPQPGQSPYSLTCETP